MTAAELKNLIFNVDSHPFDIVFRSVQIVCQGLKCECAHGDWLALMAHVDAYLRSPEFDAHYAQKGGRSIKSSSLDAQKEGEQRFFYSLGCTCDQLEQAARGPVGLFLLDMPGSLLTGVVQQDRFSVVVKGEMKMVDELESSTLEGMNKMISIALERAAAKEEDELGLVDYVTSNGPAHDSTFMRSQTVAMKWSQIINLFLEAIQAPQSSTESTPEDTLFGGSFTCGLIAARLRHVVKQRLDIARSLLALLQLYSEDSARFDYPMFEFSDLERKLSSIINHYRLFDDQLSLKLAKDNVQVSLCSWFFKGEGVEWLSKVAHIGRSEEADLSPEFNVFLEKIVEAGLQHLSPYSVQVFLARSLAMHEKYAVLMNLCTLCASSIPDELRPVMTFYSAIAYSGIGKPLKAMTNFNLAAKGITDQNKALLTALSPVGKTQEVNLGDYYVMALRYLHEHRHSEEVVEMARSAVASLPSGHECTSRIYVTLFNHLVNQGNWCDALESIMQNSDQEIKRMTLRELLSRMLHARDWRSIVELSYGKLEEEVASLFFVPRVDF
ncbi:unnamed protein product [Cylicostephanus goldi]|uniref:NUP160 middle TPR domain-containing protein n=1 Tax=Cylicostephanus goldi TaxID=71465 RepID=A0A3P6QXS2_CYLGO|nr:unnamed protein product [Cylicostephanus goldi]